MAVTKALPLDALRVLFVTDGAGDCERIVRLVAAAVAGGVRAVQLREPQLSAADLVMVCARVREALAPVSGVLFVNDRCDLVAAGCCDGAQVGHRSLPPSLARRAVGGGWLGVSCHDPAELERARVAGADFALLSPVWPTRSKPGHRGIGAQVASEWSFASMLPTVWLGGVEASCAPEVACLPIDFRPVGVAVISAIAGSDDPQSAAARLVSAWTEVLTGAEPRTMRD
jgi:thiamine-phosphate pyrophosphorylase